jgi:hypothetical protein
MADVSLPVAREDLDGEGAVSSLPVDEEVPRRSSRTVLAGVKVDIVEAERFD